MNNSPRLIYETLLADLAAGELSALQKQIFELLRDHPGGLDRYQLVGLIYGYIPLKIEGNTDDRKIRKAIEKLRTRTFPIVSTSGYLEGSGRENAGRAPQPYQSHAGTGRSGQ